VWPNVAIKNGYFSLALVQKNQPNTHRPPSRALKLWPPLFRRQNCKNLRKQ